LRGGRGKKEREGNERRKGGVQEEREREKQEKEKRREGKTGDATSQDENE
jgi:hypothetical protein